MEKESKPSVSDSKAAQEKAQGTEVKSFAKKHESTRALKDAHQLPERINSKRIR